MIFSNRYEASKKLVPFLRKYAAEDAVVLSIPRGGVPMAYAIARELKQSKMTIFRWRKLFEERLAVEIPGFKIAD